MTAALSLGPTTTFRPRPGDEDRSVLVFANLLPDEVVAARRLRALKRRLLFGIVGLWAVLVGIYGLSIVPDRQRRAAISRTPRRRTRH